jgi:hypothetical protein
MTLLSQILAILADARTLHGIGTASSSRAPFSRASLSWHSASA